MPLTRACTLAALFHHLLSATPASAQSTLDAVDRYVRAELVRQRMPGLSVAILRGDSVLLARGYGEANVELHVPASDSTIYQSGSLGKQFTSALVVMLAEEGRLGLDDSITRWFPEAPAPWKAFICYEKGIGRGGTLATVYYDAAWRASGVEVDAF